jgi:hypothetical protein
MAWWLFYLLVITSPIWMFFLLDFARKRHWRLKHPSPPKVVVSRASVPRLYVRRAALEAQFLVAPHRAIDETLELLGDRAEASVTGVESPEELRRSFEELILKVRR